jgi:peroxiredoxin
MNTTPRPFWRRNLRALLLGGGVCSYVLFAGMSGFCPMCAEATRLVGLPSFATTALAAAPEPVAATAPAPVAVGAIAPAWTLATPAGQTVRSTDYAGQVVVLAFWATWCPPCVREVPVLMELQTELGPRGLTVIGASFDDTSDKVVKFAAKKSVNYPLVMADEAVGAAYGVEALPTLLVIDRQGKVVARHVGLSTKEVLVADIAPLL